MTDRFGRFGVIDRGDAPMFRGERIADRPRFMVVEYDRLGPILRGGPYRQLQVAIDHARWLDQREGRPL